MQIKKYSLHFGKRILAKNLDVILAEDKINIISGGNGVGKTTFLDFLAGVGPKTATEEKIGVPAQRDIAYQLQNIHFFPTLTVKQTIEMYRRFGNSLLEDNESFKKIKQTVLDSIWHLKVGQLSGGERKIVLTYGQCLLNKKLYIFDEPTSGVDTTNAKIILKLIAALVVNNEKTVVMTSHNLDQLDGLPFSKIDF
ncbi:ATP-binding cassette domain-containing protein [Leuconostoc mesenteroides]|uniref:ATP-binding cassette domain-containing protein n=1 Tax=Leuconostoc mesenteroides TaxID=1245 RepID=UPI001CBB7ABD|nr:ATP-binding cassette domain-containing protein [Leuconostoc mesenteroides]MBZ1515497.1 ATP-binding cassette domain-containing protein [Leuconostoc mesenteroides]